MLIGFAAVAWLPLSAIPVYATRGPLLVDLRFTPTTATGSAAPELSSQALARSLVLEVADERAGTDPSVIGQGTDDDDSTFPVQTSNDVLAFARENMTRMVQEWGLRIEDTGEVKLRVAIVRWFTSEQNQAVGAMYAAEVSLRGELQLRDGTSLWRGVASGDARRYGKKQNPLNYNECLSDAAQEALANLLSLPDLQSALEKGGIGAGVTTAEPKATAPPGSSGSKAVEPDEVLKDLLGLQAKGFSESFLGEYVRSKTYSRPLVVADLVKWKEAGLPESVIAAAHEASE